MSYSLEVDMIAEAHRLDLLTTPYVFNEAVLSSPERINRDPYGEWIARVRPEAALEQALSGLLTGPEAEAGFCARCRADGIECKRVEA